MTQGPTPENIPATTDHSAKIRVKRNGEEIGPYSWGKPKNTSLVVITAHRRGLPRRFRRMKPLHEILGLPLLETNSPSPDLKQGKTKKVAIIAGIVVLLSGLIFAGVTYGPEMLGIVEAAAQKNGLKKDIIETPEELAEQTFDALKNEDFDDITKLYMTEAEGRAWADDFIELEIPDEGRKVGGA